MGGQDEHEDTTIVYGDVQGRSGALSPRVRESGHPVAQVARDLGIADHLLYRWRAEQQQAEGRGQTRQSLRAEQAELAQLRRENAVLKQERNFLKRAAAFFAKESR